MGSINYTIFCFHIILSLVFTFTNGIQLGGDLEGRAELLNKLFNGYDESILPDNVTVSLSISLLYLNVNAEKNELESQIHLSQFWTDSRLAWDNNTNGINVIHVSPKRIWKPDVVLYNSADFKNLGNCQESDKVIVFPPGYVFWVTPCQLRSRCNFTKVDECGEQNCQWKFASWIYDKELVDVELLAEDHVVNLEEFGSKEWKVADVTAGRNERNFTGYPNPYSDLTFNLTISKIASDDGKDCA